MLEDLPTFFYITEKCNLEQLLTYEEPCIKSSSIL